MPTHQAFAKVNLDLRVVGCRADGYHELSTVFQSVALHDTIRVESAPDRDPLVLSCDDPRLPVDDRNLVWRAAARLWQALGRPGTPRGVRIELRKRIPPRGGLGGGSADAAVALVALARLWQPGSIPAHWTALAAELGADVPFFLVGGTALGSERGDRIEPWPDVPPHEVVLACPSFGVSTPDAFRWFDERAEAGLLPPHVASPPRTASDFAAWLEGCRNDLGPGVAERHPVIAAVKQEFELAGASLSLMSGSGSTVFGLFAEAGAADRAAAALVRFGVAAHRTRTVTRAEYEGRALGRPDRSPHLAG